MAAEKDASTSSRNSTMGHFAVSSKSRLNTISRTQEPLTGMAFCKSTSPGNSSSRGYEIMKLALSGIHGIPFGKRNIKDPRLDEAHRLVEADKKTYAQVDLIGEDKLSDADAILTTREGLPDLILKDLEFVETRLGRNPPEAEQAALLKLKATLENERCASAAALTSEESQAVVAHN